MRTEYLFIGGVVDGKWIKVSNPPQSIIKIPIPVEVSIKTSPKDEVIIDELFYHTYQQHRIVGSVEEFIVFAKDSLTGDDLISKLINNYVAE